MMRRTFFFALILALLTGCNIVAHQEAGLRNRLRSANMVPHRLVAGPDRIQYWASSRHHDRPAVVLVHGFGAAGTVQWVEQVEALHGCTSTEYLDRNGFLGDDLLAVHWTFCTESDVARLAETGTWLAHCPASMSAKGPHPLPMRAILDHGVKITLGTDNMTEDMFHAMKLAMTLHRGAYGRSVTPSPQNVFDYVTVNAARALADADPMHARGARTYTLRRWLVNEGSLNLSVGLSTGVARLA